MPVLNAFVQFLISLVISAVIIYVVTKMFGEKEGFGTAILAALIGAIIYSVAYYFLGMGVWSALIGGAAWLIALAGLYDIGWLKSLIIAVVIWIISALVSLLFPTVPGAL